MEKETDNKTCKSRNYYCRRLMKEAKEFGFKNVEEAINYFKGSIETSGNNHDYNHCDKFRVISSDGHISEIIGVADGSNQAYVIAELKNGVWR